MDFLWVKWIHILSSVVLVGTGFGTAFYFFFTNRTKNKEAQYVVACLVVKADTWFTTPAVILQPITGFYLLHQMGLPWTTPWVLWALGLYVLTGLCWLPVVWLQIKLRNLLKESIERGVELPPLYWRYATYWEWLGYPAFIAMIGVFYLMVVKPTI
jgi:uncharacterized membrane protein